MEQLQKYIERNHLSLSVMADSPNSIHLRALGSSKRAILDWLENKGINIDHIAKIGDSPDGNDRPMMIGTGAFNVGPSREGSAWTIHMDDNGGGPQETVGLLEKLQFESA